MKIKRHKVHSGKFCRFANGFVKKRQLGFTLTELIVILVVVSIAAVALLGLFQKSVFSSADPMLRMQATAIAQSYLEEALLHAFSEPSTPPGESGSCEAGETRASYDDVQDYNCLAVPAAPSDQFGNALAGLADYSVSVSVNPVNIGPVGLQAAAQQVVVTVTHSAGTETIVLTGYRANY